MEVRGTWIVWVLHKQMETKMKYQKLWGYMLTKTQYPGTYRKKGGGHVVRGRAKDLAGHQQLIFKPLEDLTDLEAHQWLQTKKQEVRTGSLKPVAKLFSEFAEELLDRKLARKDIQSAANEDKWRNTLTHWIAGTEIGDHYIQGFGDYPVTELRVVHIERWKDAIAPFMKESPNDEAKGYAPNTLNSWLRVLRVISRAIAREYETRNFMEGVTNFDTSAWQTYTEAEPNALKPDDVPKFLDAMMERWPQHYAITLLGLTTGIRPSTLRPLRRQGAEPDVIWSESRIKLTRSETRGKVMRKTKTGIKYSIHLPHEVMEVLTWHTTTQLNDDQKACELLFPNDFGGFRAGSVLTKPFRDVAQHIGLKHDFTARGMRRTFQDLARKAQVEALVQRSICGHSTEKMQEYYSTVGPDEQRDSLRRVFRVIQGGNATESTELASDEPSGQKGGQRKSS